MCGISVARGTPAASAASVGARVRMSETTTAGSSRSISGSSARAASAAWRPGAGAGRGGGEPLDQWQQRPRRVGGVAAVVGAGLGRREGAVFLGRGEAQPSPLDRGAALLPGLDRDLVPS